MKRSIPLLGTVIGLLATACGGVGPSLDSRSEGDQDRDLARAVFLDRSVTDRVDGTRGDNTDWKYVDVVEQGRLRITVAIDRPDRLREAEVVFYDEFGGLLKRYSIEPHENLYVFDTEVEKIPNKFFVRTFAKDGESAYTVGAELEEPPPPEPPVVSVAPPPQPEPPPRPTVRKRPERRPAARKAPVRRPVVRKAPAEPEPPPPTTVGGRVVRVIPVAGNQAVTIAVRLDQAANVSKGARGWVFKNGQRLDEGRLTVTSVNGRTVQARVNLPPGKFSGNLTVQIQTQ